MTVEIIENIDVSTIIKEYNAFEKIFTWLEDDNTKQSALQHRKNNPSFIDGCGRLKPGLNELNYDVCHSVIEGTVFEEVIKKYNLKRTRLMWIKPKRCYSLHRDFGPRIHIPLITNPSAMFVFKETGLVHLPVGKVYLVDTRQVHSFANFGETERLHLLGCV